MKYPAPRFVEKLNIEDRDDLLEMLALQTSFAQQLKDQINPDILLMMCTKHRSFQSFFPH